MASREARGLVGELAGGLALIPSTILAARLREVQAAVVIRRRFCGELVPDGAIATGVVEVPRGRIARSARSFDLAT